MISDLVGKYYPVLDHGFVSVVDFMGNDESVTRSARVSYGKGTKQLSDNRKLIRYMLSHRHTSPFESCEIQLHIGCPIAVFRQWIRHRTANVNEYSGRYSEMPAVFYTPKRDRYGTQSVINKQGTAEDEFFSNDADFALFNTELNNSRVFDIIHYNAKLKRGMSRELARLELPLSTYTYVYWKMDLHNLLHFLSLRLDSHAQWEIRQYAQVIAAIVQKWVPLTWEAFKDYRLNALTFSSLDFKLLKHLMSVSSWIDENEYINISATAEDSLNELALQIGMTQREYDEFWGKLNKQTMYKDFVLPEPCTAEFYEKMIAGETV